MGDHGGNIALFEFAQNEKGQYEYIYKDCRFYETTLIWIYLITTAIWLIFLLILCVFLIIISLFRKLWNKVKKE
jgi:hypothetical protein